jgi:hypothetical protein
MSNSDTTLPESAKLSARLSHPSFPQPQSNMAKIWRYMDLAKFVSLIQSRSLYLARLDKLADSYEGTITSRTADGINEFFKQIGSTNTYKTMSKLFQESRQTTFVSCWHVNEHESEAMWRLYGLAGGGIAIQTTYSKLVESIEFQHDVYIGLVRYIDYSTDILPDVNGFSPAMHKRASFMHEREVRLVWYWGSIPEHDQAPTHLTMPWNLEAYVEKIYVDPNAPAYYFEAVQAVLKNMAPDLESRLEWSQMKASPFV